MIDKLESNQIFVFGSNLAGHHLGGAAKQAHEQFGAEWGVGEGLTGQCYAFPTLDVAFRKVSLRSLVNSRNRLYKFCKHNSDKEFLLTKVGTGIAVFQENEMKDLFCDPPKNLILPDDWKNVFFVDNP